MINLWQVKAIPEIRQWTI